ncbi:hypothetical protein [Cyanobium sp. Morenito 9A2]
MQPDFDARIDGFKKLSDLVGDIQISSRLTRKLDPEVIKKSLCASKE